ACGKSVVLTVGDGSFRTRLHAVGAEQAPAQIKLQGSTGGGNRGRGTGVRAFPAPVRAFRAIEEREATKTIGKLRHLVRIRNRPVSLLDPPLYFLKHSRPYRSCPQ